MTPPEVRRYSSCEDSGGRNWPYDGICPDPTDRVRPSWRSQSKLAYFLPSSVLALRLRLLSRVETASSDNGAAIGSVLWVKIPKPWELPVSPGMQPGRRAWLRPNVQIAPSSLCRQQLSAAAFRAYSDLATQIRRTVCSRRKSLSKSPVRSFAFASKLTRARSRKRWFDRS